MVIGTYTMWYIPVLIYPLRPVGPLYGVSRFYALKTQQTGLGKSIWITVDFYLDPLAYPQSRSLLTFLDHRLIVSYLTTAAMSLFLNIIIHPLDHMAQMDLETMISVANTICNTHGNESTQGERCRLQETSDFVMRLVWLGTCAVTKARREWACHSAKAVYLNGI